jgi:hypothetical protein
MARTWLFTNFISNVKVIFNKKSLYIFVFILGLIFYQAYPQRVYSLTISTTDNAITDGCFMEIGTPVINPVHCPRVHWECISTFSCYELCEGYIVDNPPCAGTLKIHSPTRVGQRIRVNAHAELDFYVKAWAGRNGRARMYHQLGTAGPIIAGPTTTSGGSWVPFHVHLDSTGPEDPSIPGFTYFTVYLEDEKIDLASSEVTDVYFANASLIVGASAPPVAGSRVIDYCISDISPWFQTDTGDVRFPTVNATIPNLSGVYVSSDPDNPSIFFSSETDSDFLPAGSASAKNYIVDSEYPFNRNFETVKGVTSYTYYMARTSQMGIETVNHPCPASNCDLSSLDPAKVHILPAGSTITTYTHPAGGHVVILVNGDISIATNINLPSGVGNLLVLAAKGDITVTGAVGTTDHSNDLTTQLDGIFTAEGDIIIDGYGASECGSRPLSDFRRLNVAGGLIANSDYPFKGNTVIPEDTHEGDLVNNRSLCSDDVRNPALKVYQRYDFIPQLTDFYKESESSWKELAP